MALECYNFKQVRADIKLLTVVSGALLASPLRAAAKGAQTYADVRVSDVTAVQ
jgi:hypothetical protein